MRHAIDEATRYPRELFRLLDRTLRALFRNPPPRDRLFAQMYNIGNGSLVFIGLTLAFLGLILVYQGSMQSRKVLPDLSMVGATFIMSMVREFGPTITGMMIATRVGAGIAAEIGSMVVTDQVEAMKVTNTDPIEYIVAPRFLATLLMMAVLTAFGVLVAVAAGTLMGATRFQIAPQTFLSLSATGWSDLWTGLAKCFAYGIAIPIISAESGFRAAGGSEGVGWATTRAVVNSSFAVVLLDFLISSVSYLKG